MKYIVTGSTGHISKPLAKKLIAAGHDVTIVTSKDDKRKEIEALGAQAAVGSVEDVAFLSNTFKGADAVYAMVPPNFAAADWKKHITRVGQNYAAAIRDAGVRNVVFLSSIGAHLSDGCGPVSGLFGAEKALNELQGVNVKLLRPGFFFYNFYANIGMIKHMGFIGGNYGEGSKLFMVHTDDIAAVAAEELLNLKFSGKSHRYIVGDDSTTDEVASALGAAIGKPDLKWVNFTDEQSLAGLLQAGLPSEIAKNYTEMGAAMRTGIMGEDYVKEQPGLTGKIRLKDFAKEFAAAYNA
jgi:uncharacterized protein YbjT (DUF2867 family)